MEPDSAHIKQRTAQLYRSSRLAACRRVDRLFAGLFVLQWLVGVAVAIWYSPHTWIDRTRYVSIEVTTAVALGAAIIAFPLYLIYRQPGYRVDPPRGRRRADGFLRAADSLDQRPW